MSCTALMWRSSATLRPILSAMYHWKTTILLLHFRPWIAEIQRFLAVWCVYKIHRRIVVDNCMYGQIGVKQGAFAVPAVFMHREAADAIVSHDLWQNALRNVSRGKNDPRGNRYQNTPLLKLIRRMPGE